MQDAYDDDRLVAEAIEDEVTANRQAAIARRDVLACLAELRSPCELRKTSREQSEIGLRLRRGPFSLGEAGDGLEVGARGGRDDKLHQSRAMNCSMSSA